MSTATLEQPNTLSAFAPAKKAEDYPALMRKYVILKHTGVIVKGSVVLGKDIAPEIKMKDGTVQWSWEDAAANIDRLLNLDGIRLANEFEQSLTKTELLDDPKNARSREEQIDRLYKENLKLKQQINDLESHNFALRSVNVPKPPLPNEAGFAQLVAEKDKFYQDLKGQYENLKVAYENAQVQAVKLQAQITELQTAASANSSSSKAGGGNGGRR